MDVSGLNRFERLQLDIPNMVRIHHGHLFDLDLDIYKHVNAKRPGLYRLTRFGYDSEIIQVTDLESVDFMFLQTLLKRAKRNGLLRFSV